MRKYNYHQHFSELKQRFLASFGFLLIAFGISYLYKENISLVLVKPLADVSDNLQLIFTSLPESFLAHLNIAFFTGLIASIPFFSYQVYQFIVPGLYNTERKILRIICTTAPLLFYLGCIFVYYFILPTAWNFFLSFDSTNGFNAVFQGRIYEYFSLIVKLMVSFGLAFELPIVLTILFLLKIVSIQGMIRKRRIFIVISFVIAGIITPPDILTQVILAVPMCLLYEVTIVICKKLNHNLIND